MRALLAAFFVLLALPAFAADKTPLGNYSGQVQPIKATDTVQTSAPTTANASINLPHGTAPSSPSNGDCWTTTLGLYCQINGSTVGPYGTGSLPSIASGDVLGNSTAGAAAASDTTLTSLFDRNYGSSYGTIIYRGNSAWTGLTLGANNSSPTVVPSYTAPTYPAFVHAGTWAVANSSQTSLSVPYPSSVTAGDLLLMQVVYVIAAGSPPQFTVPPTGYTTLASGNANTVYKYLFAKAATGSEGGTSITLNNVSGIGSGGSAWSAQIFEFSGVNASGTYYESLNLSQANNSTPAGHTITTTSPNELGVHMVGYFGGGGGNSVAVPTGWTGQVDEWSATSGSAGSGGQHMDTLQIATASVVTGASSASTNSIYWGSFDFALIPASGVVTSTAFAYSSPVRVPQGRLTLVNGTPVMTSDTTGASFLYYDCYLGSLIPYFDGSTDQADTIPFCQASDLMQSSGTGVLNSSGVFDVFWSHANGSICVATNGSGGGWASDTGGSNTARGTGYSQIHNTRGYYTNQNAISHCYNAATDFGSIAADKATYLGTLYTTAAGQTGVQFRPAAASGGASPIVGLFNAYNRVIISSRSIDNAASWTSTNQTWETAHASTSERVSWVDGLGIITPVATLQTLISANSGSGAIGLLLDATTGTPVVSSQAQTTNIQNAKVEDTFAPSFGFHFIQGMQAVDSNVTTATYYGGGYTGPVRNGLYSILWRGEY